MESVRAATAVCSLPPCGGGLGRGGAVVHELCPPTATPTPNPSPQGGGEHTVRVATVLHPTRRESLQWQHVVAKGRGKRSPKRRLYERVHTRMFSRRPITEQRASHRGFRVQAL